MFLIVRNVGSKIYKSGTIQKIIMHKIYIKHKYLNKYTN